MMRVTGTERKLTYVLSAVVGLILTGSTLLLGQRYLSSIAVRWDDLPLLGFIAVIFPPAVINLLDRRWRNSVDKNLPFLVKEIAEGGSTGLTLERAIEAASKRRYGPLTDELKRVVAQMSWGISLETALQSFAERVDTRLVRRTMALILETSRTGGDVRQILESIYEHVNSSAILEKERRSRLRPYIYISYIAFAIFIVVGILLFKTFFVQINESWKTVGGGFGLKPIDIVSVSTVFYHMAAMQAFFGGLIAGKISEGLVESGLKHALILMIVAFLVFHFLVF